jgi:hypothetical protein
VDAVSIARFDDDVRRAAKSPQRKSRDDAHDDARKKRRYSEAVAGNNR